MPTAISMPRLGMTMEEGTVVQWPVSPGDRVEKGDLVLIIESEKNEVEIEAQESGVFRHVYVEEGETVACGSLLAAMTESADEPFDAKAFHAVENRPDNKVGGALEVKPVAAAAKPAASARRAEKPVAPAARVAAKKLGIDPQDVSGTGPNGRVTRQDVEAHAAARESLVPVAEGVSLEVLVQGEGDAVVLLPGLGTDVSAFARQAPMLAERFCVHGVNPRGVGLSDAPSDACYAVGQTAADAAATYEGAAHIIGASLGSAAAIELALTRPERVRSLVLITPFLEATARLQAIGEGWCRMSAEATSQTLAGSLLPWFFSTAFLADEAARARTLRGLSQTLARVPSSTLERMTAGLASWSGSRAGDLAQITVPTLVIAASEDLLTPGAEALAAEIPNAKLIVVEGAGHAVALESPDAVNAAIAAHLA